MKPLSSFCHRLGLAAAFTLTLSPALLAADPPPERGPFWSGTVMRTRETAAAMKGVAITLGAGKTNHVVYDLDTLRLSAAWSGDFLEFGNTLTKIEWPPPPAVKGSVVFETVPGPGWADQAGKLDDPRVRQQGPLPKDWVHHSGLYVNGDQVVLRYTVGSTEVLETPGFEAPEGQPIFIRTLRFGAATDRKSVV